MPFKFLDHPLCPAFSAALNNTYAEPLDDSIVTQLFTNANQAIIATNAITVIRTAIIDTIMISSTADCTLVAQIVNSMLLFAYCGNPAQKYPLCSMRTVTTAFDTTVSTI